MKTKLLYIILFCISGINILAQNDLIIGNNKVWPDDYSEEPSYNNMTIGNGSTVNVQNKLTIFQNLYGNNNNIINVYGTLIIEGDIIFNNNSNVEISGNIIALGNVVFNQNTNISIDGTLDVTGDLTIGDNSNVTGTGTIIIDGENNISPKANIDNNVTIINNPLPIELGDISIIPLNEKSILQWYTYSETNNEYFTIERSYDLNNWDKLLQINGAGNSNNIIYYEYEIPMENSITYYRLKQTDYDGKYHYSKIIQFIPKEVIRDNQLYINIYQNQNNQLIVETELESNAQIIVSDINGKIVYQSIIEFHKGINTVPLASSLSNNLYFVNISNYHINKTLKLFVN